MTDLAKALDAACRESFDAFAFKAFSIIEPGTPYQWNWHIGCIAEHLEASFRGEIRRLIINVPPRCLKSVLVGQMFPAWAMGKEPNHKFIGASYAHSLAERNVVKARQIMLDEWYARCFPETLLSRDQNQKDYFTTSKNGQYKGTGIGGSITGFGCDTLLIDDPINPKEAASDTIRLNAVEEIRSTLFSRFNDQKNGRLIMIMQRLHEADPTGELLRQGDCTLLKLPAEAKTSVHIRLGDREWGMEQGELLSERLPSDVLDQLRMDLGEYHYVGQYLQEPVPVGGGEFKHDWPQRYQHGGVKPKEMNIAILVDPAGGEEMNKRKKKNSDWTAMMVIGLAPDNNYYWLDGIRDRFNPTERVEMLFLLHRKWNGLTGKPPKVGYEKYGMMTDTHYIREKQRMDAYNFPIIELGGTNKAGGFKEERIRRLIPDLQQGRWYYPPTMDYVDGEGRKFDLVHELINSEMKSFPRARHDDMLDAMSRIYDEELGMVFPRAKTSMTSAAVESAYRNESTDWMDW
jgi:phage terminase large subunit-like protein